MAALEILDEMARRYAPLGIGFIFGQGTDGPGLTATYWGESVGFMPGEANEDTAARFLMEYAMVGLKHEAIQHKATN
jgi:hypothetical protein